MNFKDNTLTRILLKRNRLTDFVIPVCMLLLFMLGCVFIYSAQSYVADEIPMVNQFWVKQIIYILFFGIPVYLILSYLDYKWIFQNAHWLYLGCILLLLPLVLKEVLSIPIPFVQTRYNATRWINLGFFSIQPSEFAKIGTCIMLAAMLAKNKLDSFRDSILFWFKLALVFIIPIFLIFLQPDLGSSLVFFPMLFSMLLISGLPYRFFVLTLTVFAIVVGIVAIDVYGYHNYLQENNITARDAASQNAYGSTEAILPLKDYQRNRILAFVLPDVVDRSGMGVTWNQRQSLIAVATGGSLGKGITEGTQAKLGYLPSSVAYNDFIFSVVAEESGFLGGAFAIMLMAVIVAYGCVRAAQISRDKFGQYLCIGIATILMTHSFINVGMTIGIMPITGLPLPMLSYGGTFVLTCCVLLGIVQSVYRHRRDYA